MRGLLFILAGTAAWAGEPAAWKFRFGSAAAGWTAVAPTDTYSAAKGYGFDLGLGVVAVDRGQGGSPGSQFVTSDRPFCFSVSVPEGNYRVTVVFGDAAGESTATVKAESRRLMLENVQAKAGACVSRTFIVNVRNSRLPPPPKNAPGGDRVILNDREHEVLHWDDKLTLEFDGSRACLDSLEIARADDVPTLFLAGDSTVTDQPREPAASWGQMLPRFFKPTVAVANHAESGETLKSFIAELRLAKILSQIKRGDYLLMQFGHNDEKQSWPQTYVDARTTYRAYLRVFIAEARLRGATPVLVTPVQRRQFDPDGRIRNSHGDFPEAMREVAREEQVALIDLERMSRAFYEALGPEKAPLAFSAEGRDPTHHDDYGAYELAKCVAQAIRADHLPLAGAIIEDFPDFDPACPDAPESFHLQASPFSSDERPRGN